MSEYRFKNKYEIDGDVVTVDISTPSLPNMTMLLDLEDFELLKKYKCGRICAARMGDRKKDEARVYATFTVHGARHMVHSFVGKTIHQLPGKIYRRNGNTLDNRKENFISEAEYLKTGMYQGRRSKRTEYTGIWFDPKTGHFSIKLDWYGKRLAFDAFSEIEQAVAARNDIVGRLEIEIKPDDLAPMKPVSPVEVEPEIEEKPVFFK
jgi:hypothetical protein